VLHKLDHPSVIDLVEKRPDIKVEHPVHLLTGNPDVERIQRIVLAPPWPKTIRKAQKILFPNLVEDCPYRVLDDFVLQRRDSQWSLPSIAFRDPDSPGWFCLVSSTMDSPMKVAQSRFQGLSIFFPCHSVHSWGRLPFQAVVAIPEQIDGHMV
jgi:hypothetical protein